MKKVDKKIIELKSKFKFSEVKQVLKDPKLISYYENNMSCVVLAKLQITFYLYARNIPSTPKRIRFIEYYIKHLSASK